jgi:hypothetical protein
VRWKSLVMYAIAGVLLVGAVGLKYLRYSDDGDFLLYALGAMGLTAVWAVAAKMIERCRRSNRGSDQR